MVTARNRGAVLSPPHLDDRSPFEWLAGLFINDQGPDVGIR